MDSIKWTIILLQKCKDNKLVWRITYTSKVWSHAPISLSIRGGSTGYATWATAYPVNSARPRPFIFVKKKRLPVRILDRHDGTRLIQTMIRMCDHGHRPDADVSFFRGLPPPPSQTGAIATGRRSRTAGHGDNGDPALS
jgi:hypothetical protein